MSTTNREKFKGEIENYLDNGPQINSLYRMCETSYSSWLKYRRWGLIPAALMKLE